MRWESTPLDSYSDMNIHDEVHNNATGKWWKPYDTSLENVGLVRKTWFAQNNNPMIIEAPATLIRPAQEISQPFTLVQYCRGPRQHPRVRESRLSRLP